MECCAILSDVARALTGEERPDGPWDDLATIALMIRGERDSLHVVLDHWRRTHVAILSLPEWGEDDQ